MELEQLQTLARLHYRCAQYERALELLQQILHIQERDLGPQHIDLAGTLHSMAEIHCEQSNFNLAKPLYLRAMAIWHKAQPGDYLDWMAHANLLKRVQGSARCFHDSDAVRRSDGIQVVA